jgi:hypothetical protein
VPLTGVIDDRALARYRLLLDEEDAAFDELAHAYEEGDRDHFESEWAAWQSAIERKLSYLSQIGMRLSAASGGHDPFG